MARATFAGRTTDTTGMNFKLAAMGFVIAGFVTAATAGEPAPCHGCRPSVAGRETPCGDTGFGPRYRGEIHEPSCPDPCDACNRWREHHGGVQAPDMLVPWQMAPGRGFMTAAQVGYDMRSHCRTCMPLSR